MSSASTAGNGPNGSNGPNSPYTPKTLNTMKDSSQGAANYKHITIQTFKLVGLILGIILCWGLGVVLEYYVFNEHRPAICVIVGLVWAIVLFIPLMIVIFLGYAIWVYLSSSFYTNPPVASIAQPELNPDV